MNSTTATANAATTPSIIPSTTNQFRYLYPSHGQDSIDMSNSIALTNRFTSDNFSFKDSMLLRNSKGSLISSSSSPLASEENRLIHLSNTTAVLLKPLRRQPIAKSIAPIQSQQKLLSTQYENGRFRLTNDFQSTSYTTKTVMASSLSSSAWQSTKQQSKCQNSDFTSNDFIPRNTEDHVLQASEWTSGVPNTASETLISLEKFRKTVSLDKQGRHGGVFSAAAAAASGSGFKKSKDPPMKLRAAQDTSQDTLLRSMYLTHLSTNFANDWSSSRRLFVAGAKEKKTEDQKQFLDELAIEFSEQKPVLKLNVPKLQTFAKKIKNITTIKNCLDKKYIKGKEEATRKKQMMADASAMDAKFIDFEVTLKNFCINMQQFLLLNTSKELSAIKIQQINGFNSFIRQVVFDDLTGLLRSDFSQNNIGYIISCLSNFADYKKKRNSSSMLFASINNPAPRAKRAMNLSIGQVNMELVKKLYYFNRSLEDFNNERISENRNIEVMNVRADAQLIEDKLYSRMLANASMPTFSKIDVFKELRLGTLYPNGNPFYSTAMPITQSIEKSEKLAGKFDHILHRNRYQAKCLDQFTDKLKYF